MSINLIKSTPNMNSEQSAQLKKLLRHINSNPDALNDRVLEAIPFEDVLSNLLDSKNATLLDLINECIFRFLKEYEIETGSSEAEIILDTINFEEITSSLNQDPEFKKIIISAIKKFIESDDYDFSDSIAFESLNLSDIFNDPSINTLLLNKIRNYIKNTNIEDLPEQILDSLDKTVFSSEKIESLLNNNPKLFDDVISSKLNSFFEEFPNNTNFDNIIIKSPAFNNAIEKSISTYINNGSFNSLINQTISNLFNNNTNNNSILQNKISQEISSKLVNNIAETLVNKLFSK